MLVVLSATGLGALLAFGCAKKAWRPAEPIGVSTVYSATITRDPLPSWNGGPARQAIIDLVARASTTGSPTFVPEEERIAAFDDDGTLVPEEPLPEAAFTLARVRSDIGANPVLANQDAYQDFLRRDVTSFASLGREAVLNAMAKRFAGTSDELFEQQVHTFFVDSKHPRFDIPYPQLVYQPMRELMAYLTEHKFRIYLCTAGDVEFARAHAPTTYGIPREHIIGSSVRKELAGTNGRIELRRTPEIASFNDKAEKVVNIERVVGRRPIVAAGRARAGNDVAMLGYVKAPGRPWLALVIRHDDAARELVYGQADDVTLDAAKAQGFTVVSMRNDWSAVFAPPPAPAAPPPKGGY